MDVAPLLLGLLVGVILTLLVQHLVSSTPEPASSPEPLPAPEPSSEPEPAEPAQPAPEPEPAPPKPTLELAPTPPARTPAAHTPALLLVAYACPQCGASIEIPAEQDVLTCTYCEASIRVEGRGNAPPPVTSSKPATPAPRRPGADFARPATLTAGTYGRFAITVLRQAIYSAAEPREAMRFVPLDERRAGLFLIRLVNAERDRVPFVEPRLLVTLADVAVERLRERRDPGLAVKAVLRALAADPSEARLEMFAAVFDAEKSAVTAINISCDSALIHCSREEARTIDPVRSHRQPLVPLDLEGNQEVFANHSPIRLGAGDAVVVTSAALAGDGRGWAWGQGSTHRALKEAWPAGTADALAVAVKDRFWSERGSKSIASHPPVGDLLVVAVTVASNAALAGPVELDLPPPHVLETERFDLALGVAPDAFVATRALHGRRHALVWIEAPPDAITPEAKDTIAETVFALLDGKTGDNDNPRRGGADGFAAAKVDHPEVRCLALFLGDEHGKVAFWTRGWGSPFHLASRADRGGGSLQQFSGGGHAWPRDGSRLLFPGLLFPTTTLRRAEDVGEHWTGGKASALYAACRDHEEEANSAAFLTAVQRAIRTDKADASLAGLAILTTKPD